MRSGYSISCGKCLLSADFNDWLGAAACLLSPGLMVCPHCGVAVRREMHGVKELKKYGEGVFVPGEIVLVEVDPAFVAGLTGDVSGC